MALAHSPKIVTSGLVLCLDAANAKSYPGSGTTWTDLSGLGNTGTLTNSPSYSSGNLGSLIFDNVASKIVLVSDSSIIKPASVTVSAWVFMSVYNPLSDFDGQFPTIAWKCFGNITGTQASYGLSLTTGGVPRFTVAPTALLSATALSLGVWTNVVGTYSVGGSMVLYRNGSIDNSTTGPATISHSTQQFSIGSRVFNGAYQYPWNGNIAQVSIYNRALSAAEIRQNFNALRGRYGI
jgi:hypothetical protein